MVHGSRLTDENCTVLRGVAHSHNCCRLWVHRLCQAIWKMRPRRRLNNSRMWLRNAGVSFSIKLAASAVRGGAELWTWQLYMLVYRYTCISSRNFGKVSISSVCIRKIPPSASLRLSGGRAAIPVCKRGKHSECPDLLRLYEFHSQKPGLAVFSPWISWNTP